MGAAAPSIMGRYDMLFRLGRGGMAEVWAARQTGEAGFEKLVAVKRMLPHLAETAEFATMFYDEGNVAANISSPHVVATYDLGIDEGAPFIAMEFILGLNLRDVARKGALPLRVALSILRDAGRGLHDAHAATTLAGEPLKIVHRDVSPHNVLVGVDGRARIGDFGIARAVHRMTETMTGQLKGKLSYFSPEQAGGEEEVDARSDVFSLGIVAWETLAGEKLFKGEGAGVLRAVLDQPIPRLDQMRADVTSELADVVASALERDVNKRTPSALEFVDRLRAAVGPDGFAEASEVATFMKTRGEPELEAIQAKLRRSMRSRSQAEGPREPTAETALAPPSQAPTMNVVPGSSSSSSRPRSRVPLQGIAAIGVLVAALAAGAALAVPWSVPEAREVPSAPTPSPSEEAPSPPLAPEEDPSAAAATSIEDPATEAIPAGATPADATPAAEGSADVPPPARAGTARASQRRRQRERARARAANAPAETAMTPATAGDGMEPAAPMRRLMGVDAFDQFVSQD